MKNNFYDILKNIFIIWLNPKFNSWVKTTREFNDLSKIRIGKYELLDIYLINGDIVKTKLESDFVEGSNDEASHLAYDDSKKQFVPNNEIWLDSNLDINSIPYICFHEIWERQLINKYNFTYDEAHKKSNELEMRLRKIKAFEDFPKSCPSKKSL